MGDSPFRGEALRLARYLHGYTQAELGTHVGATRQYVHQLENGARKPTEVMIDALAYTLAVKADFFFFAFENEIRDEQCHFRKQKSAPTHLIQQSLAHGTMVDRVISFVDSYLELPRVNFPHFDITRQEDIERAAEQCRALWKLTDDQPIINMVRVVENAGAVVTEFQGISDKLDALSIDRARPIIVRSNAKQSVTRFRFDLAHECGHLVMHQGICTGDTETESQADRFAGAFLLPRVAFVKEFPRASKIDWPSIYQLKIRWKTSLQAIVRRAHELEILTPNQYRIANAMIAKRGFKKNEPYEPRDVEHPELLKISLATMWETFRMGTKAMSEALKVQPALMHKLIDKNAIADIPLLDERVVPIKLHAIKN